MQGIEAAGPQPGAHLKRHRAPLPLYRIGSMSVGLFGIQVVWGLHSVNTSRIFQTLGAQVDQLPILWIAAPVTGLLVQPIVGFLSDRTWGRMGRRRPYLLTGAIISAGALVAMPNATSLWSASLMLWLLTAAINIAMEPFRALLADTLPEEQRNTGFAIQVAFIGLGAVFASSLPWAVGRWLGAPGVTPLGSVASSVRLAYDIGAASLVATVAWTFFTTPERTPENLSADEAAERPRRARQSTSIGAWLGVGAWVAAGAVLAPLAVLRGYRGAIGLLLAVATGFALVRWASAKPRDGDRGRPALLQIVDDLRAMPDVLRGLAVVQFFTWFGLFAMWIYTTPALVAHRYGAIDPGSAAYNATADKVGVVFAAYNGVAAVTAFALPKLTARVGRRRVHAALLLAGALGMAGLLLAGSRPLLGLSVVGLGLAWASIMSMPYAMLSGSVPPTKMGVYMGLHNVFLVLPQLVAAAILGPLIAKAFGGRAEIALWLAAGSLAVSAALALGLPRSAEPESLAHP